MKEDQNKFLAEVHCCRPMLLKLVSLYAEDLPEREDLAQDILLQAWTAWPRFRGESKFSTWFYRICLNTILTHQRKNRPQCLIPPEDLIAAPETRDTPDLQALYWAIRQLGQTDRALITMNLEGYDHAEIAAVFGISNNHVSVKLTRIKQQLTKLLQHEHGNIQQKEPGK